MNKKSIDVEVLRHPAFRKNILKKRDVIYRQFGKIVDSKFKTVDKFKLFLKRFKVLAARAHKKRDLNTEEQAQYAKMKTFIRSIFKIGPCTFPIRVNGKLKKVSFNTISYALKSCYGIHIVKHGKSIKKNEHWENFFIPVESEIGKIYTFYKTNLHKEN